MTAPATPRRVVITGLGIVSPLGNSPTELWDTLTAQRSGVAPLQRLPPIPGQVVFGGEARSFSGDIDDFGPLEKDTKKAIRKALKMMCRESMMAVAAAQKAIADAAWQTADPERCGVVFGSDYMLSPPEDFILPMSACGIGEGEFRYSDWGSIGLRKMNPLWMLSYLPNMPASHIAIFNDLRGPNNSLTLREASSMAAVAEAYHTIVRGHADRMIAGATGTRIHPFKTIHAIQTETLANPDLPPERASAPFDADATGMVLGEGAGALVLETRDAAEARGATIYGEILGVGSAACADPHLQPNLPRALVRAGRMALAAADRPPESLGHLAAHGSGSPSCDTQEAQAIGELWGPAARGPAVVAAKASMGNLGAGSGIVEMVASLLALRSGHLYRTLNFAAPHPTHPKHPAGVVGVTRDNSVPAGDSFLQWGYTPQGQCAAVVAARA